MTSLPWSSRPWAGRLHDSESDQDDFRIRLLIVDDEQTIRRLCMTVGESLGFFCLEAESGDAALALLEEQPVHMVLTDMVMPRMSGLEFLEQAKRAHPRIEVAVMTGHGSVETAVQAMKLGAYDYIAKPFAPLDELRLFLRRMADKVRLVEENLYLRERSETETAVHGIIGSSTGIQNVLRLISRLKDTRTPVLISGESGTGKELVARALHFRGTMASRPFVAVDCGSLVPTLIESELFGYEKGAFTGALRSKQGLLQSADTGTIFLDEVGELPLEMQAKLLRFLQEKEVRPVGSNQKVKVDVRIMAATNRDLDAEYKKGTFRKDLYFRLNVVTISLPPLRERRSDIPILAALVSGAPRSRARRPAFRQRHEGPARLRLARQCPRTGKLPGARCRSRRSAHHRSQRSAARDRARGNPSDRNALDSPERLRPATDLEDIERATIERVFSQVKGDKDLAGKMLGISRATLYRKLKRYNIGVREDPPQSTTLQ